MNPTGHPLPKYLTASDVRAIHNDQWEAWIKAGAIPWHEFRTTVPVREAAFTIAKATTRRLDAESRATS